jgi:VWFA-related protein
MRHFIGPAIVASSVAIFAQQPPPTFRAATELVEVDVVARDRNGALVTDLTAADFTIEENGEPQKILQFRSSVTGGRGGPPPSADARMPAGRDSRAFLAVIDDAHLSPAGFKRSQAAAQLLFSREFQSGDLGGIVMGGRVANNRMTTDREELLRSLKDAKPTGNKSSRQQFEQEWPRLSQIEAIRIALSSDRGVLAEVLGRACADDPQACRAGFDAEAQVQSKASQLADQARVDATQTLQTLRALMNGLVKIPGRKTILLLSEGFIADESWPMVQDVLELAVRANCRIYALDPAMAERGGTSMLSAGPGPMDASGGMLDRMDFAADSLNSLAVDTGGFVIRNTNVFDKAIARIGEDVSAFYVLGYRPSSPADGKFHRIGVRLGRPGVTLRARRGYIAVPQSAEAAALAATEAARRDAPDTSGANTVADSGVPPPGSKPDSTGGDTLPAATNATGTVIPSVEPTAAARVRPGAESNAYRLAPTGVSDPDAREGWAAYQRGDLESAHLSLSRAARRGSEPWIHYTLGMSSYALAQFREAADAWEQVRAGAADFEPVYFDLIEAYLQLKDFDRAIRTARFGLERWPQDADLFQAMGVVQTVRGSLDDAVKSFQTAAALAPSDPNVYFNLGKAMELRYYKSRRYVDQLRAWVSNEAERTAAIANYKRYLTMNGVYGDSARAGLARLEWMPTPKK